MKNIATLDSDTLKIYVKNQIRLDFTQSDVLWGSINYLLENIKFWLQTSVK